MQATLAPDVEWSRFVARCQADPELSPYVGTILTLARAVLGDAEANLAVLDRVIGHRIAARSE